MQPRANEREELIDSAPILPSDRRLSEECCRYVVLSSSLLGVEAVSAVIFIHSDHRRHSIHSYRFHIFSPSASATENRSVARNTGILEDFPDERLRDAD